MAYGKGRCPASSHAHSHRRVVYSRFNGMTGRNNGMVTHRGPISRTSTSSFTCGCVDAVGGENRQAGRQAVLGQTRRIHGCFCYPRCHCRLAHLAPVVPCKLQYFSCCIARQATCGWVRSQQTGTHDGRNQQHGGLRGAYSRSKSKGGVIHRVLGIKTRQVPDGRHGNGMGT